MIFAGLNCKCGEVAHYQGASYYVSVSDGPEHRLVVGPFPEHDQALAHVDAARREILAHWNPGGRAHWYGYGTCAVKGGSTILGKLNDVILNPPGV